MTVHSNFEAQGNKICEFPLFPFPWSDGPRCHDPVSECWVLMLSFSHSSFTLIKRLFQFSSAQFSRHSVVSTLHDPWIAARQVSLSITNTQSLLKLMSHPVCDAIQPSHPLSSPSPPAPNPSQHQVLFQSVNSKHEVAKVLEFQLQHQSFQWTPRTDLL